jgi:hypothetical protein
MAYFGGSNPADYLKSSGSGAFLGSKPMSFGWDTALLGAGTALSGLFDMFGANKQAQTMANVANAQMAAQADALVKAREAQKGNMAMSMFGTIFPSTTGADLEYGRQLAGKRLEYSEFMPKEFGLKRDQMRWETAFENSPAARALSRNQRRGRIAEAVATSIAPMTAMYGPIGRINVDALAG